MFHSILLLFNIFIFFSQTLCKYLGQHTYIVINSINYIINYLLFSEEVLGIRKNNAKCNTF